MRLAIVTALVALALPSTALAADVPPGATWTQATIPSSEGVSCTPSPAPDRGVRAGDPGTQLSSYLAEQVTAPVTPATGFSLP